MNSLIYILLSVVVFAGNRVGNGGDVLVCEERKPEVQLLDIFEAEEAKVELLKAEGKFDEILMSRLDALNKVAPKLADQYRRRWKSIQGELDFKEGVSLTNVKDSLHAVLPKKGKCKLKQIVIKVAVPAGDSKKEFLVDKELWSKLSSRDQAALMLHEIIYEHFFNLGAGDSRHARKLNGLIFSKKFEKMEKGPFWLFIKDFELPLYP